MGSDVFYCGDTMSIWTGTNYVTSDANMYCVDSDATIAINPPMSDSNDFPTMNRWLACEYCGQHAEVDKYGGCVACGAPRKQ